MFTFYPDRLHRDPHSFPTRRSSDLLAARGALRAGAGLVTIATPREALPVNAAASLAVMVRPVDGQRLARGDRKSTRLNSSHANISYAVFCLKKKNTKHPELTETRQS